MVTCSFCGRIHVPDDGQLWLQSDPPATVVICSTCILVGYAEVRAREGRPSALRAGGPQWISIERAKLTPAIRYAVLSRDAFRCRACGLSVEQGAHLHIDHIHPLSRGGETRIGNLQSLCSTCNIGKGARLPDHPEAA